MPQYFTLSWVPGSSASSQTVQYRVKNVGTWTTSIGITPANPINAGTTSATVSNISTNTIYQLQVLSNCCPGTEAAGAVLEGIIYEEMTLTTSDVAGVISVDQVPMPAVDTITYRLATTGAPTTYLQTITATGTDPAASFTSVGSGDYVVKYSYTTQVNGVNINSYDADQNNAFYASSTITV